MKISHLISILLIQIYDLMLLAPYSFGLSHDVIVMVVNFPIQLALFVIVVEIVLIADSWVRAIIV